MRKSGGRPASLVILCGHYEGIDERVRLALHPEEMSVGDYVLTGGELAALVLIDAAARLVPGVLGDPASIVEESFTEALLEYPHYTRPAEVRGMPVPEVLLSGHHEAIRLWRRKEALRNTYQRRPDLLQDRILSLEDQQLLNEVIREGVPGSLFDVGRRGSLMNRLERIQRSLTKKTVPNFEIGDTVRVHVKVVEGEKERIQVYEGQ